MAKMEGSDSPSVCGWHEGWTESEGYGALCEACRVRETRFAARARLAALRRVDGPPTESARLNQRHAKKHRQVTPARRALAWMMRASGATYTEIAAVLKCTGGGAALMVKKADRLFALRAGMGQAASLLGVELPP